MRTRQITHICTCRHTIKLCMVFFFLHSISFLFSSHCLNSIVSEWKTAGKQREAGCLVEQWRIQEHGTNCSPSVSEHNEHAQGHARHVHTRIELYKEKNKERVSLSPLFPASSWTQSRFLRQIDIPATIPTDTQSTQPNPTHQVHQDGQNQITRSQGEIEVWPTA